MFSEDYFENLWNAWLVEYLTYLLCWTNFII